ncbi:MAG: 50S ribosomal protein L18, large subunit ribosomal protein L18 [Candidatus Peregrinibacteria bacterium GW2011_GWE2_39_6]|nr:MAG: 50S ribosomal protein L18, large subunit ribosomal protein L18 [Candidatus Peregrinibacteria bacterium GW2011_GWF2_39_17]KKR26549.1 MAG: 50S ribosomal protein L18, large subunit ribosomal protein L18 [Candidatus Peregrinibacteria bacterium GW2011_GWE2_39_6]
MQKKDILRKRRHLKIRKKMQGTTTCPRLVVYRSLKCTYAQLVDDTQGKTLLANSDLKNKKGKALDRALQTGKELAEKALAMDITTCVFDRNGYKYHGRVKALAEGARQGGLKF